MLLPHDPGKEAASIHASPMMIRGAAQALLQGGRISYARSVYTTIRVCSLWSGREISMLEDHHSR